MNLFEQVFDILARPAETWPELKHRPATVRSLFTSYAVLLAAIPAIAHIVGATLVGIGWLGIRYRAPFLDALGYAATAYVLSLVDAYVLAVVLNAAAPKFDSVKNFMNALKLSVYSATPYWVAGALFVFPLLSGLAVLLGAYRIYLLFTGLTVLMNTPRERRPLYLVFIVVVGICISVISMIVASLLFPQGRLGLM